MLSLLIWLGISAPTILSTEGGLDRLNGDDRPRWAGWVWTKPIITSLTNQPLPDWIRYDNLLAHADLAGVVFAELPPDQADYRTARDRFRKEWCDRQGLRPNVCGPAKNPPAFLDNRRLRWCIGHDMPEAEACQAHFSVLDTAFHAEWRDYSYQTLTALDTPDLTSRDLRGANLIQAQLPGANLWGARMAGANLFGAQLAGANLFGAQLAGANLSEAQMEGAILWGAHMEKAILSEAQMEGANLSGAQLERAILSETQMEGANLWGAQMVGAILSGAQLEGANLREALFNEVTDFSPATLRGAGLKSVDLSMLYVDPDILAEAFGDSTVILPADLVAAGFVAGDPNGPLAHWSPHPLDYILFEEDTSPFHIAWRAWQTEIGYVPLR